MELIILWQSRNLQNPQTPAHWNKYYRIFIFAWGLQLEDLHSMNLFLDHRRAMKELWMYWSAVTWRERHLFYLWQNLDLCFVELHLRVNTWLFFSGDICLKLLSSSYFLNLTHFYNLILRHCDYLCLPLVEVSVNTWMNDHSWDEYSSIKDPVPQICENGKTFPLSGSGGWQIFFLVKVWRLILCAGNLCLLNNCGLTLVSFRDLLWRHLTGLLVQQYIIRMQLSGCCCFFIRGQSYLFKDFLYMSVASSFLMALVRSLPTSCMPGQPEKAISLS